MLSLFHTWLYNYHVEGQTDLPDPGFTPYYDKKFFNIIREVKEDTPLNPAHMTVKEWYRLLLEKNKTMRQVDQGRMELVPCKVEEKEPLVFWGESYRISRLHGLSSDSKSFLFKMIHTLLPSKERIHRLLHHSVGATLVNMRHTCISSLCVQKTTWQLKLYSDVYKLTTEI